MLVLRPIGAIRYRLNAARIVRLVAHLYCALIVRFTPPTKLRWLAFERRSASQIQNTPTPDNHKHDSRRPVRHDDAVLFVSRVGFRCVFRFISYFIHCFVLYRCINGKCISLTPACRASRMI